MSACTALCAEIQTIEDTGLKVKSFEQSNLFFFSFKYVKYDVANNRKYFSVMCSLGYDMKLN